MGNLIDQIKTLPDPRNTNVLANLSLAKIREYHGGFTSVWDAFSINLTEFEQIFSLTETTFNIFDTDHNGLIDALELFSGMILFADAKAEEKIRFMFDLFDFNEIQSISIMDLEYMILGCCITATAKMYGLDEQYSAAEITKLVSDSFPHGQRITLPQLLVWSSKTDNIKNFFRVLKLEGPEFIPQKQLTEYDFNIYEKYNLDEKFKFPKGGAKKTKIAQSKKEKRAKNFRSWLHTALNPIIAYRTDNLTVSNYLKEPDEINASLEWVYGLRCADVKRPLQYSVGHIYARSKGYQEQYGEYMMGNNEEIIYFTAWIVVLFNHKLNQQRFYTQHEQEVISCAVSNESGDYIASGELSDSPVIHVWNSRTLENLSILSGVHRRGVHLLAFSKTDKYLVSCGLNKPSAVIIYDWRNESVLVSTSILSPTQDIFILPDLYVDEKIREEETKNVQANKEIKAAVNEDEKSEGEDEEEEKIELMPQPKVNTNVEQIVILSKAEIWIFDLTSNSLNSHSISIADSDVNSEVIWGMAIVIDDKNAFYKNTGKKGEKKYLIMTGHKDGSICLWKFYQFQSVLINYRDEITCMNYWNSNMIAFCTVRGYIYIWDSYLSTCLKIIELSELSFKMMSFHIVGFDFNKHKMLITTIAGDALEISMKEKKKIRAKKFNSITKINGTMKGMGVLNQMEDVFMIGGESNWVYSYDVNSKELIDIWVVGLTITAISCISLEDGGFIVAVGTDEGKVAIRQDWEEVTRRNEWGSNQILDIQFSKTGTIIAVASQDQCVYLLEFKDTEYQPLVGIKIENGFPISLTFSEDSTKILITTNKRQLLLLDPRNYELMSRIEDVIQIYWNEWNGRFSLITKNNKSEMIPVILGQKSNLVACGDEFGCIHIWKNAESVKENVGCVFTGHGSQVQKIALLGNASGKIVSMGLGDRTVLQWNIEFLYDENEKGLEKPTEKEKSQKSKHYIDDIKIQDDSLINELNYAFSSQSQKDKFSDSAVLVRASTSKIINRILAKNQFDLKDTTWKRPPPASLILEHVYGMQLSDRRNSVRYLHLSSADPEKENKKSLTADILGLSEKLGTQSHKLELLLPKLLGPQYKYLLEKGTQAFEPLKYEKKHTICHKNFVYYSSRLGIVFNPIKNKQDFYEGHRLKISALALHPTRALVATGEVNLNPEIHIWEPQTLETLAILNTSHKGGILHLTFSGDGHKVISVGMDATFSIQIFQWEQQRTIAFRNTGKLPIFCVKADPYDHNKFITCGYQHISLWNVTGNHLSCSNFIHVETEVPEDELKFNEDIEETKEASKKPKKDEEKLVFTWMDYINHRMGNAIESDIYIGSNKGSISWYTSDKHIFLARNAHEGIINCIKVSDIDQISLKVITWGEDGFIKIWDPSITLIQKVDVKIVNPLPDLNNPKAYGIQSVDVYICDKKKKKLMLIGVRSGEIIEAELTEHVVAPEFKDQHEGAKIEHKFVFRSYLSSHSSLNVSSNLKKIHLAVNSKYPLFVTVGDDETIRLWDIRKRIVLLTKNLGARSSAVAFHPDGDFLAVGLTNGILLILDSKMKKLNYGTYQEEFDLPPLDIIMNPKESKGAIISIRFSSKGDFLAVSYDNEKIVGNAGELRSTKFDTCFVQLYVNRHSSKALSYPSNSKDLYIKAYKIVLPLADFQSSVEKRNTTAVAQMDFSNDDLFLQMCSMKIDQEHVRDYAGGEDIFAVWDIDNNELVNDYDTLKKSDWITWTVSNAIYARFLGNSLHAENPDEESKLRASENCIMSACQKFPEIMNTAWGNTNGDIFLFKFPALFIDKSKHLEFTIDNLLKKDMALTRSYSAHSSMVMYTELFGEHYLLSVGLEDQCIMQWKIEYEDNDWELDFNKFIKEREDPFREVPIKDRFSTLIHEIWAQRIDVSRIQQDIDLDLFENPPVNLEIESVIGRRAFDRRNNVMLDCQDRIVSNAASLIIFMETNPDYNANDDESSTIKQTFLSPDDQKFTSISPEISWFTFNADKRILVIGTAQVEANIIVWEIGTNLILSKFILPWISVILYIKIAHDNRHLIFVGLTENYVQAIVLVDFITKKIITMRQILHSLPYKIKDIQFFPNSIRRFVTCGIQHLSFWRLNGRSLEFQIGELSIPKSFSNLGGGVYSHINRQQGKFGLALVCDDIEPTADERNAMKNEDLETIYVTFLCWAFLKDTLITCGDDGFLYLWEHERIVRRVFAHEGAILCMDASDKFGLLASGGTDGTIILWRLRVEARSHVKSLDKLIYYSIAKYVDPAKALELAEYNVQSVCIGKNRILIGTRSGNIFEIEISEDDQLIKPKQGQEIVLKKWIQWVDHETPRNLSIDKTSTRIFTITTMGMFSIWDLRTFELVFTREFYKRAKMIYSFKLSNKVMLVFENEIIVLDSDPIANKFEEMARYNLKLNTISDCKVNNNERILGVATISAAAPEVSLYDTEDGFTLLKTLYGFKSSIRYIDFSTDNYYLQCEDNLGEIMLFEIETQRVVHTDAIDFELEWLGEGLKSSSTLKGVHYFYDHNNKITEIAKVIGLPVVAIGDDLGTIRLFSYPNKTGEAYYQWYADHLYSISNCIFSPNRKLLLSTSEYDRCIIKWRVKYRKDIIEKYEDQN